jgi:hypothetical protein
MTYVLVFDFLLVHFIILETQPLYVVLYVSNNRVGLNDL